MQPFKNIFLVIITLPMIMHSCVGGKTIRSYSTTPQYARCIMSAKYKVYRMILHMIF